MTNTIEKCYMCEKPGTTTEHVPPKCIFPEKKDAPENKDLRKNLITVPSCEEHNTEKSQDDFYLFFTLAANILSNNSGENQIVTKIKRAHERSPNTLKKFMTDVTPVTIQKDNNELEETIAFKIDKNRFDKVIKHIAYGLYYKKCNESFEGEIQVINNSMIELFGDNATEINDSYQAIFDTSNELFKNYPAIGENPEIFTYKIYHDDTQTLIEVIFYGNIKILIIMKNRHQ